MNDEERPSAFDDLVRTSLAEGWTPNDIGDFMEEAISAVATDWVLWGDGEWRLDTVCPICGDAFAGVCGHGGMYEGDPILRREYKPDPNVDPNIVVCHDCKRHVHIDETSRRWVFYLCPECAAKQEETQP